VRELKIQRKNPGSALRQVNALEQGVPEISAPLSSTWGALILGMPPSSLGVTRHVRTKGPRTLFFLGRMHKPSLEPYL